MSLARTARLLEATKPVPFDDDGALATAIAQANLWTAAAAPIVKAIFALEDAEYEVRAGCDARTWDEVRPILGKPQRELREMLDGIRDNFLSDQMLPQPSRDASDDAWDARDAFQDELERSVTTVDALIRKMEREA
jgi:hypothetical protein